LTRFFIIRYASPMYALHEKRAGVLAPPLSE
jgi:hypothetical protein